MSRNYFEALPGDRAHAILSESSSEYVGAFLDLYEEAVGVFTRFSPEPHHLSTKTTLRVRNSQDDTVLAKGKFAAVDQDFPLGGRPRIERVLDIDIEPTKFSLSSLLQRRLDYGLRAEATSSLELQLDANTKAYGRDESRLFDISWKLTTANGTKDLDNGSKDTNELYLEEAVIKLGNYIDGSVETRFSRTALHIARLTVNGDTQTEIRHSESRDPIDPITMLENSRSQVLFPASQMLISAGVQKT